MRRYRRIAAAPQRSSADSWQVIAKLIRDSLERSSKIEIADVDASLGRLEGLGRQLVAGGHLDRDETPLIVIAADLDLCLNTVSGQKALGLEENLNFVPGAAGASEWTIYVPSPEPLVALIATLAAADEHLSDAAPSQPGTETKAAGTLDQGALREWARERS